LIQIKDGFGLPIEYEEPAVCAGEQLSSWRREWSWVPVSAARRGLSRSRLDWRMSRRTKKGLAMSIDRGVLAFAGLMVLLSLALGYYGSPYWYLLTAFVGLNLLQSSVTGFCPAAIVLRKLGVRPGAAFK
jgi:hypothetical protein